MTKRTAWHCLRLAVSLLVLLQLAAAATLDDARPVIRCYRCIPNEMNRFCADEFVDDNTVDCTSGRCLMMGAEFARQNDVARLYDCDNHNIVDWAFQVMADQSAEKLNDNTCQLVNIKSPSVIDAFRNYGMSDELNALLRGAVSGSNDVGSGVNVVEMCTCSTGLCNSADGNAGISLIKARNRAPPPTPPPPAPAGGLAWWWIVIITLSVLILLVALAALGVWLYKRSQENHPHPHYQEADQMHETRNKRIVRPAANE